MLGDLDAQYATCNIGEREMLRLFERYGDELEAYFDRLIDYGEALTRKAIAAGRTGTIAFTDYIDGDGFSPAPIPIVCRITVKGDHLWVDFAGSSPQVKGAINSTLSFVKSSTYLADPLRARPRRSQQCRRLSLHHGHGAGGLDPQSAACRRRSRPGR